MRKVTVKPKSEEALNKLKTVMGNNNVCTIEEDKGDGMLFLSSQNGEYFFWVNINDEWECDWLIV